VKKLVAQSILSIVSLLKSYVFILLLKSIIIFGIWNCDNINYIWFFFFFPDYYLISSYRQTIILFIHTLNAWMQCISSYIHYIVIFNIIFCSGDGSRWSRDLTGLVLWSSKCVYISNDTLTWPLSTFHLFSLYLY